MNHRTVTDFILVKNNFVVQTEFHVLLGSNCRRTNIVQKFCDSVAYQEIICHLQGVLESYIDKVVESRQRRNRRRLRKIRVKLPDKPTIVRGDTARFAYIFKTKCVRDHLLVTLRRGFATVELAAEKLVVYAHVPEFDQNDQASSSVKEQSTYFEEAKKTCAPGSTSRQNKLKHIIFNGNFLVADATFYALPKRPADKDVSWKFAE